MQGIKNSLKDNDLDDVSGGIDVTTENKHFQSLTKKKAPKKTLSDINELYALSFEEKRDLARKRFGLTSEVDDIDEDALTIRLKDAYKNRI